ncbi:MAG: hypothetical protein V7K67_27790 [Nostoc sp.]|uniref:hypothetical protein n=1 Tax=Nostoc sp. TaxID=1180 RepID=UPI002FFC80E4
MKNYDGSADTIGFGKWLRQLSLGDRFTVTNIPYELGEIPFVAIMHGIVLTDNKDSSFTVGKQYGKN